MPVTNKQIEELEKYFANVKLPKGLVLEAGTKINDVGQMIQSYRESSKEVCQFEINYHNLLVSLTY